MTRVSLWGHGGGGPGPGRAGLESPECFSCCPAVSRSFFHILPFLFLAPWNRVFWTSQAGVRPSPGERVYSQPISFALAPAHPEAGAGRAGSLGSEQMQMGAHQPWSHICCRTRQVHLVGGSRRKALPTAPVLLPGWCPEGEQEGGA